MKSLALSLGLLAATASTYAATISTDSFGKMPDGREVKRFTLTNDEGMKVTVIEYGAILATVETPDAKGKTADITLGYDDLKGWLSSRSYFGATVGRFANRIADGKFTLDGKTYTLAKNDKPGDIPCHLHGGVKGFDKVLWSGTEVSDGDTKGVALKYRAKDGEEGYPGNVDITVTYWLNDDNELTWDVKATTDAATIINVAQHTYWNLSGEPLQTINDHILEIDADRYLPTTPGLIPTGELASVKGTPMDFRKKTRIGDRVNDDFTALKYGGGYDHAWVVNGKGMRHNATVHDPKSGRTMKVYSDQPAIQFYGGNFLDGTVNGKGGAKYPHRSGLCLETEGFPDAPNQKDFPSVVLRPGETYKHTMKLKFSAKD